MPLRINPFLRASAWRVALEASLITLLYTFLLTRVPLKAAREIFNTSIDDAFFLNTLIVTLLCTLWAAVRIRRSNQVGGQSWRRVFALTLILMVLLCLSTWLPTLGTDWLRVLLRIPDGTVAFILPALSAALYPLFRLGVHLWLIWQCRSRRSMVLWLTNTILAVVAFMILGGTWLVNLIFLIPGLDSELNSPYNDFPLGLVQHFFTLVVPMFLMAFLTAVVTLLVLLPFAILFSYLAAQRTTRRIDQLAQAAAAFRMGDYGTRVQVDGEDEVARLQTDFNVMADQLASTLADLKSERDTVTQVLQARRDLVAGVSHELRTPVATLRAAVETTLTALPAQDDLNVKERLELMDKEIERLSKLIDDLFTLSQAEVNNLRLNCAPTELAPLLEQVVATFIPFAWQAGRVEVNVHVAQDLPRVQADADRLKQVLLNLLRNAVRHTSPGGIVAILAEAEAECVRIEVRDTGEGIDPDDLAHIWERFYRGKNVATEGAGLGLALVRELAEAMGGSVDVESVPGEGSCFTVRLVSCRG
ncbi:MAG TPA: HAMP domain-containing sensor histidine kinase [Anaerolineales bacterium]|nr:HAMP domain-containing sensor histidine kinase [Anaerolineales bacterium]